ncbi:uncharacterized protein LOC133477348 isoform X1 [Phyllopteryx taeniolatus]|uniref:uncharacterized protein LOC133477348 isoform X1 n=1 Tax=Phyllopteryx taeniolatus TaxID=161469 RepID=UPI002AD5AC32|nr:uncharacterized protein LOC133477348 isoform X1 [Phyllopteryx taeniolatus]
MKSGGVVVLWLGLVSVGCAAPPMSCETLLTPINISNEQMLGRWLYIGGSSDLPGSRSLGHLLNSIWLDISATSVSNVLAIFQTQRIYGECSGIKYNVTMENSTMLIERPFYLKEVYLQTDCSDCLVVYEEVKSSQDSFRSLLLFSRHQSVSPADVEMLKMQAKCLQMPSPLMMDTSYEVCPDNIASTDGIAAFNSLLEAKMGQRVATLLDKLFDLFIN